MERPSISINDEKYQHSHMRLRWQINNLLRWLINNLLLIQSSLLGTLSHSSNMRLSHTINVFNWSYTLKNVIMQDIVHKWINCRRKIKKRVLHTDDHIELTTSMHQMLCMIACHATVQSSMPSVYNVYQAEHKLLHWLRGFSTTSTQTPIFTLKPGVSYWHHKQQVSIHRK